MERERRTVLSLLSPSFLPISLVAQSSFLSLEEDIRPGTTRGIVFVGWRVFGCG